jgi:hypothetical protein
MQLGLGNEPWLGFYYYYGTGLGTLDDERRARAAADKERLLDQVANGC